MPDGMFCIPWNPYTSLLLIFQRTNLGIAQIASQETEFIQLQNPPDGDCSIYSELYLRGEKI